MVFGLFGKNNSADMIMINGRIFTQDSDLPWADAVAIKDGKVLAVGAEDELARYRGKTTEFLDLNDHFVIPGLIDAYGTPVLDVFAKCCCFLDETSSLEETVSVVGEALAQDPGQDTFFAYGYGTDLLKTLSQEEATGLLDALGTTRPILLLSKDGYGAWINSVGLEMVNLAAEEEAMEILTLPFTISVLNPFSYEKLQEAVIHQAWNYAAKGYTCLYNSDSPDSFDNIYQNVLVAMHQESLLPQRHYGALSVMVGLNADFVAHKLVQNRTKCIELEELINFNTLKLYLTPENATLFSGDYFKEVCQSALERGFDLEIQVIGKDRLLTCFKELAAMRAGGNKKSCITVIHNEMVMDEERYAFLSPGDVLEVGFQPETLDTNEALVENRTLGAAEKLALLDKLGTIEPGKYADFAIYEENPMEGTKMPPVVMTLLNGVVVFHKEEDRPDQWNQQVSQQNMDYDDMELV